MAKTTNARGKLMFLLVLGACAASIITTQGQKSPPNGGLLLVANKGDRTLSIVDPVSGRQVAAVAVGGNTGHEVIASPDGRTAWVPIYGNSGVGQPGTDGRTISIIDLGSHSRIGEIDLGGPSRPHCALFGKKTGDYM